MAQMIGQRAARAFGAICFVIGAGALVAVFFMAYGIFKHPLPGLGSNSGGGLAWTGAAAGARLVACFVMAYAGWLLCGRGIQLYSAARRG